MAFTTPTIVLPRHIVSCTVYGGVAGSTGAVTWSSGTDISSLNGTGRYKGFNVKPKAAGARVDSTDNPAIVNVTSQQDLNVTISELQAWDGSTALLNIANTSAYIKIVMLYRAPGLSSGGTYRAVIARIADGDFALDDNTGANVYTLNCDSSGAIYYEGSTLPTVFS